MTNKKVKPGTLWLIGMYKRAHVILCPEITVAFGDNWKEEGYGGQAKEVRGCLNGLGIPTKWIPSNEPSAYFQDKDIGLVGGMIMLKFEFLEGLLLDGRDVAYPYYGIGTGLSQLEITAPKIMSLIHQGEKKLHEAAGVVIRANNLGQVKARKIAEGIIGV